MSEASRATARAPAHEAFLRFPVEGLRAYVARLAFRVVGAGRDDARGHGTDRTARPWRRAPVCIDNWAPLASLARGAPRPRDAADAGGLGRGTIRKVTNPPPYQ